MIIHNPKELSLLIRNCRNKQDMGQADVSDLVGLRQATISAFENDPGGTKIDTLFRILSALNLDIHITSRDKTQAETEWQEEW